ncbi:MAG TPA: NCS2 family permease [Epulopiscium sp.]|nr:NCS2 family permease [Candidatus Epulonipiscium sp.]
MSNIIEKLYGVSKENSSIKIEVLAGLTSFVSISYIIAVNAALLSTTGMPYEAVAISTIICSVVACLLMSFLANSPLILVPGMGDNTFFVFTLVGSFGLSWQQALAVVLFAGIIFILTSVTKIASRLVETIPQSLISGMSAGIGLFVAFLGLKNGGIIVASESTFVTLGELNSPVALTTIITLVIILVLYLRNVQGSFLIGIISGTVIGYFFGIVDTAPLTGGALSLTNFNQVVLAFDFSQIFTVNFWIAVFSLSMFTIFQNMGVQLGMLPDEEKFPKSFLANGIAVAIASALGCCSIASAAEGAAGVAAGGKTGLTSLVAGLLFIPAIFLLPLFKLIPMSAVSPILMIVGCLMFSYNIKDIKFKDFTEAFPVYLMLMMMPLSFNIANGIAFGFIFHTLLKVITGRKLEISKSVYVISFLFLLYFILGAI